MTNYTAGFLFSENLEQVCLVKKLKPKWQAGKWNAVGGKVELGESAQACMSREFWEETGVRIHPVEWTQFCSLMFPEVTVKFYWAISDKVFDTKAMEEEKIEVWPLHILAAYKGGPLISNLPTLMELAQQSISVCRGEGHKP